MDPKDEAPVDTDATDALEDAELDETSGAGLWPPPPVYPG